MKNLLLALTFLTIGFKSFAQDLRCIAAPSYLVETGPNEKKVNSPASVCYYGRYFSFYTKATGTVTFEVVNSTTRTNKEGFVEETFLNEQNPTNMRGDYSVEIVYGKIKTVVISYTKFGQAYVIQSNGFLGSPENDLNTKTMAGNLKEGKLGYTHDATPTVDVTKWFLENTDMSFLKDMSGDIDCYFKVDEAGNILDVKIRRWQFENEDKLPLDFDARVRATLLKIPKFIPGRDSKNKIELTQAFVRIKINES